MKIYTIKDTESNNYNFGDFSSSKEAEEYIESELVDDDTSADEFEIIESDREITTAEQAIEYIKSLTSDDETFIREIADHGWNNITNGDLYNDDDEEPSEIQEAAKDKLSEIENDRWNRIE